MTTHTPTTTTSTTIETGAHSGGLPTPAPASAPAEPVTRHRQVEGVVQVVIMLAVAAMAGAASFRHVHDWTMHNSPAGTGDWFGWANAMVSELIPLAAGLEARRRHRLYGTAGIYPIALILGAVALSLTGQFAEAKPGLSGWVISAVPALGFLALVKLVLSGPATSTATGTGTGQNADTDHADRPAATTPTLTGPVTASTADPEPTHIPTEETSRPEVPAHLLPSARLLSVSEDADEPGLERHSGCR